MKQIIPVCGYFANYAANAQRASLFGGSLDQVAPTYQDYVKIPLPWTTTFRNLTLLNKSGPAFNRSLTLLLNGGATDQAVLLPSGDEVATSSGLDVVGVAGEDVSYAFTGTAQGFPGDDIGYCIEAESAGNIFGIASVSGSRNIGQGWQAGAFGNGRWEVVNIGDTDVYSVTRSLAAVPGAVTHLCLKNFAGALGAGVWTALIRKNLVRQDGSPGTVDTRCVLDTSNDPFALATFVLPIALKDRVEVMVFRSGDDASFAIAHVAAGIGFVPTVAGRFMCCGGNNAAISASAVGWRWNESEQLADDEDKAVAPVGPTGFRVLGLYTTHPAPGSGKSYLDTLQRSGADTPIAVTVADSDVEGLIEDQDEAFVNGETIGIEIAPSNTPTIGQFHWGLAATVAPGAGPSSSPGVIGPHQWIVFPRTQPEDVT